jgi:hypothetical protein
MRRAASGAQAQSKLRENQPLAPLIAGAGFFLLRRIARPARSEPNQEATMKPVATKSSRGTSTALAMISVAAALAIPTLASARTLSGTHSSHEIKLQCDAAGGVFIGPGKSNGGKYGCDVNGGGMVYCSKKGKCEGSDPPKRVSGTDKRPITDVLTTKGATNGSGGSKVDTLRERLRNSQANSVTTAGDSRKTPQTEATTNQPTTKGPQEGRHQPARGGAYH